MHARAKFPRCSHMGTLDTKGLNQHLFSHQVENYMLIQKIMFSLKKYAENNNKK